MYSLATRKFLRLTPYRELTWDSDACSRLRSYLEDCLRVLITPAQSATFVFSCMNARRTKIKLYALLYITKYHYNNCISPIKNPPCTSAREPCDAHHGSSGNTTSTFEEQPEVDRTWEEGEEAARWEREMKWRNGRWGVRGASEGGGEQEDRRATYASEDPALGRTVEEDL